MAWMPRVFIPLVIFGALAVPAGATVKLVALPDRGKTVVRLDRPGPALIEEERDLALQKGQNEVVFSWKGMRIEPDSIFLRLCRNTVNAVLTGAGSREGEAALTWRIYGKKAGFVTARITYLLRGIDRRVSYRAVIRKGEGRADLEGYVVVRNFSGRDMENATLALGEGRTFRQGIRHGETLRLLFLERKGIPVEKRWVFDAGIRPWVVKDPGTGKGIPFGYRFRNTAASGLGAFVLPPGKVRVFQEDGHGGTVFAGEDRVEKVPVGEPFDISIGNSRDVVVTQRKMRDKRINVRRNRKNRIVLYDTDEVITAAVRNFRDRPARLTMIEHIPGQWDMAECSMTYRRTDAHTLEFEIELPAKGVRKLRLHYHRRNVR